MSQKTFYINLNNPVTNIQEYDPIEAYKVCTNLINKYFDNGIISQKSIKLWDENWKEKIISMIEIKVITENDHAEFLNILKVIYNQKDILVEIMTEDKNM